MGNVPCVKIFGYWIFGLVLIFPNMQYRSVLAYKGVLPLHSGALLQQLE